MAQSKKYSPWRIIRYIIVVLSAIAFFVIFIIWRTDNPRVETLRFTIMDRYTPDLDWLYAPFVSIGSLVGDFQSYEQLSCENRELRQQLQQMESWKEAALQLEQINAELRALNNLSQTPQAGFVTGEVIADSGTRFSQTALINIGRNKGVEVGQAAVDGLGVIGRVIGIGEDKSRVLLISDPTSQVSALIMPEGIRAVVTGNNGRNLNLQLIEGGGSKLAGKRVVTSGVGVYPEDLLLGHVVYDNNENLTVRIAANLTNLDLARILLTNEEPDIPGSNSFIGEITHEEIPESEDDAAIEEETGDAQQ